MEDNTKNKAKVNDGALDVASKKPKKESRFGKLDLKAAMSQAKNIAVKTG